jgi:hypothetical protein
MAVEAFDGLVTRRGRDPSIGRPHPASGQDSVRRIPPDHGPIPGAVENGVDAPAVRRPRTPGLGNPVRISRIGSDHLQVFIRSAHGCKELLALVDRLEQLVDAGYDTIDVVFEAATRDLYAMGEHVGPRDALASHEGRA